MGCLQRMARDMRFPTMCDQQRLRPACAYAQSDQSLCMSLEYYMTVKLLTEHHLEFLSLKGVYTCQNPTLFEITCRGSIPVKIRMLMQKSMLSKKISNFDGSRSGTV